MFFCIVTGVGYREDVADKNVENMVANDVLLQETEKIGKTCLS